MPTVAEYSTRLTFLSNFTTVRVFRWIRAADWISRSRNVEDGNLARDEQPPLQLRKRTRFTRNTTAEISIEDSLIFPRYSRWNLHRRFRDFHALFDEISTLPRRETKMSRVDVYAIGRVSLQVRFLKAECSVIDFLRQLSFETVF